MIVRSSLRPAVVTAMLAAVPLSGCGSINPWSTADETQPAARTTPPSSPPLRSVATPAPPVDMNGRWTLASSGTETCIMMFAATAGGNEGSIAPEGGCPGTFFTSRRFAFDQGSLVIRDHKGEPLAHLVFSASGRFEGRSTSGEPVSLTR